MESRTRKFIFVIMLTAFLLLTTECFRINPLCAQTVTDQAEKTDEIIALISCKGLIDDGLYQSIRRRTEMAIEQGATYVIYQIETYGGLLKSGDDISKYFILEAGKKVHTVAYVTTEAISAGAMISVGCKDIIMLENTTIGDCAPVVMGGSLEGVEREKAESFTRAAFMRAAEANNYPPALLVAMVSQQIEVYQVKNLKTGKHEYFEYEDIPVDPNLYDIDSKKRVVRDNELLTLTAQQAKDYGIARAVVKDLDGVISFLSARDGVTFSEKPIQLELLWSEQMVRWINSPQVMAVLVLLAFLGVYVELNTPGIGLPALVAVVCGVIIVGSKYLIGLANWIEVAIFVLGIILLLIEIFVIPGFGIAGIAGILCLILGLFGMLVKNPPDQLPWPQTDVDWDLFLSGILSLSGGFVGFLIIAWIVARYLPRVEFLSGLTLPSPVESAKNAMNIPVTAPPQTTMKTVSIGDRGESTSVLRPAGTAVFEDKVVDVVTQGEFIDNGQKIEIIKIYGNRVVVKKITE